MNNLLTPDRIYIPEMLMICGFGQNVGKTTLACKIISHFRQKYPIIALKVSPHFHADTGDATVITNESNWQLMQEFQYTTKKDSSRMLQSGAEQAFFLQAKDKGLIDGFNKFRSSIPEKSLIICESAALHKYFQPSVLLVLRQLSCRITNPADELLFQEAVRIITFTVNGFDFNIDELLILNNSWKLKN